MDSNQRVDKKIVDRTIDEEYPFRKRVVDFGKYLRFYYIPSLSILILVVIFFLAIKPNLTKMFELRDDIQKLEDKDLLLDTRLKKLKLLDEQSNDTALILAKINTIIPTEQSEVVTFRERVVGIIEFNGIRVQQVRAGENRISADSQQQVDEGSILSQFEIIEIPTTFVTSGGFSGFRNFLKELYGGNDFFVVRKMELAAGTGEDTLSQLRWSGNFELIKYQYSLSEDVNPDQVYLAIQPEEQPDEQVIKFVQENFIDNSLDAQIPASGQDEQNPAKLK